MSAKAEILARFSGQAPARPLYLPDLTLWYPWHRRQGSLPDPWKHYSLPQVARALGSPAWLAVCPWRIETPGVEVITTEQNGERIIRYETPAGPLSARWSLSPKGEWWQTEYPVKTTAHLAAALEVARARVYVLDPTELTASAATVADDGLVAIEMPRRPYSDLLHEFVGWGEGLLLLRDAPAAIQEMIDILETKLQDVIQEMAPLPEPIMFSPDNLDAQFISPAVFETSLADSYRHTAEVLHQHGKRLLVHVGGPIRRVLASLAACGVDGIAGIAGPPQSDVTLVEAREIVGPELILWGGIPQDFVLDVHDRHEFEASVRKAVQEARGDPRTLLGIADRVPADADLDRLKAIPALIEQALSD